MIPAALATQKNHQCSLSVAWAEWAPYIAGEKQPEGTQIDLLDWIADEMGCQFKYKKSEWTDNLKAIQMGQADILGNASKTTQREYFAYFSSPYRESIMVLYVRKGTKSKFKGSTIEELLDQGFVIGLTKDAYYGEHIQSLMTDPKYKNNFAEVNISGGEQVSTIADTHVDGVFESPFVMDSLTFKQDQKIEVEEYPIEIVAEKFHFMLSKKSVSLETFNRFNQALLKVKQSKQYKSHWFWSTIQ